jgi:membrane fusion protein, macrolide-specific efflux system
MNVRENFRAPEPRDAAAGAPRAHQRTRRTRWGGIAAGLLAAAVLAGGGYYFAYGGSSGAAQPIVATATRGDVEDVVTAVGTLEPLTTVDVGAQVSGQLKTLRVQIGDDVQKGQLLAEIDPTVFAAKVDADKANLQNLQAQLLEKQASLVLATQQASRQDRLMNDNATSQDAYDTAQSGAQVAAAQVKALQAQIEQSASALKADEATLGYSKIYAPMSGTVTAIPAKEGQTLNANQQTPTILTISDLSTMTVSTQVSEADVSKLRVGMDAYFTTLGDPNRRFTGKLRQILPTPTVTNNVVLYTALFDVANPRKQLMTQMTAQVFFIRAAAHNVVTVPVAALHFADGLGGGAPHATAGGRRAGGGANGARRAGGQGRRQGQGQDQAEAEPARNRPATVTLITADGSSEERKVVAGVTDRVNAEVVSGLSEGDKVVAGTQSAAPGAQPRGQGGGALGGVRLGGFR